MTTIKEHASKIEQVIFEMGLLQTEGVMNDTRERLRKALATPLLDIDRRIADVYTEMEKRDRDYQRVLTANEERITDLEEARRFNSELRAKIDVRSMENERRIMAIEGHVSDLQVWADEKVDPRIAGLEKRIAIKPYENLSETIDRIFDRIIEIELRMPQAGPAQGVKDCWCPTCNEMIDGAKASEHQCRTAQGDTFREWLINGGFNSFESVILAKFDATRPRPDTTSAQGDKDMNEARRIFEQYSMPNSMIDNGNLYWALGVALHHYDAARPGPLDDVHDLFLCEADRIYLKPGALYRFKVDPKCAKCIAMDKAAEGARPASDMSEAESLRHERDYWREKVERPASDETPSRPDGYQHNNLYIVRMPEGSRRPALAVCRDCFGELEAEHITYDEWVEMYQRPASEGQQVQELSMSAAEKRAWAEWMHGPQGQRPDDDPLSSLLFHNCRYLVAINEALDQSHKLGEWDEQALSICTILVKALCPPWSNSSDKGEQRPASEGQPATKGEYLVSAQAREATTEKGEGEIEILHKALVTISEYGHNGICPYGCDTPHIAARALGDWSKAQPAARKDEESKPLNGHPRIDAICSCGHSGADHYWTKPTKACYFEECECPEFKQTADQPQDEPDNDPCQQSAGPPKYGHCKCGHDRDAHSWTTEGEPCMRCACLGYADSGPQDGNDAGGEP